MNEKNESLINEHGLPRYLDMQAKLGYTKHIGGSKATRELLGMCQISSEKVVLNVGCGAGGTTTFIVENYGCRVVGVDIKENMIESARNWAQRKGAEHKTDFRVADAQELPFEDDTFDILICESVNIFIPDKAKAAREYKRVIKPGGAIGLNEPIFIKPPSPAAKKILQEFVGHEILPPADWEALISDISLSNIITKTYPIKVREESRSQMGFFSRGDMISLLGNMLKVLFGSDPFARNLIKQVRSNPKEFYDFFGYGLFVGWNT
jgi:ubiquinone/menaquinone biosynthesis C-methylase UbiE